MSRDGMVETFMGKSVDYWVELDRHAEAMGVPTVKEILEENCRLRSKVGHAEKVINDSRRILEQFK